MNPFEPGSAHEGESPADWLGSELGQGGSATGGRGGSSDSQKRPDADADTNLFEEEPANEDEAGMFDYDDFVDDADESAEPSDDADADEQPTRLDRESAPPGEPDDDDDEEDDDREDDTIDDVDPIDPIDDDDSDFGVLHPAT